MSVENFGGSSLALNIPTQVMFIVIMSCGRIMADFWNFLQLLPIYIFEKYLISWVDVMLNMLDFIIAIFQSTCIFNSKGLN